MTRKAPDQRGCESNKAIRFDELVKIDAQELSGNAEMASEVEVFCHLDHMVLLLRILKRVNNVREKRDTSYPFTKVVQNLDFHEGLMVEPFLIPDNLHSNGLASAMVPATEHLAKRSFAQGVHDLVAEGKMVAFNNLVITSFIVIPIVVGAVIRRRHNLLTARSPAVDGRII